MLAKQNKRLRKKSCNFFQKTATLTRYFPLKPINVIQITKTYMIMNHHTYQMCIIPLKNKVADIVSISSFLPMDSNQANLF